MFDNDFNHMFSFLVGMTGFSQWLDMTAWLPASELLVGPASRLPCKDRHGHWTPDPIIRCTDRISAEEKPVKDVKGCGLTTVGPWMGL